MKAYLCACSLAGFTKILLILFLILTLITGCYPAVENTQSNASPDVQDNVNSSEEPIDEKMSVPSEEITEPFSESSTSENIMPSCPVGFPDDSYELELINQISSMTVEEKAAQLILARCPVSNGKEIMQQYQFGGYVMFKLNFDGKNTEDVQNEILGFKEVSDILPIIAVDEEGGTVVRISSNPQICESKFRSPQELIASGGLDEVAKDAAEKSLVLKNFGINLNLAPVADVSTNINDYIYNRTTGMDSAFTSEFVKTVVENTGIASTLKHFPGYGNNVDTHNEMSIDSRSLETLRNSDLKPFEAGIAVGAECVMVSHNIVVAFDDTVPASLSHSVHKYLREDMGFEGVIITDDLAMDAISYYTNGEDPSVAAILAGNDMIITSDYILAFESITEAIRNGTIDSELVDQSLLRILKMKSSLS